MHFDLLGIFNFFFLVNAQNCKIVEVCIAPGLYNATQQYPTGFCHEWVIGPVSSIKV